MRAIVLVQFVVICFATGSFSQVPKIHQNLSEDAQGIYLTFKGEKIYAAPAPANYTRKNFETIQGSAEGLLFDFNAPGLNGWLYYGFIPQNDGKFAHPVFVGRSSRIARGITKAPISQLGGKLDMIDWMQTGKGTLGYRIIDQNSQIIYDGKINFDAKNYLETFDAYTDGPYGTKYPIPTQPFKVAVSIIEGPLLSSVTDNSATIFFRTNLRSKAQVVIGGKKFKSKSGKEHVIELDNLEPDKVYDYQISYSIFEESYSLRTAPEPGSRTAFSFAYASDSRSGNGGGERNLGGTNAYIIRRIMALNNHIGGRFMQFTGDMITGYAQDPEALRMEYVNWKMAISPYARYIPVITGMGNHEASILRFETPEGSVQIDQFPFDISSGESIYQQEFINPENGPDSEDGSKYDPDPNSVDFPSYKESVFYYTYDNVAMVVLNSDYWYAPTYDKVTLTGGNIHGYVMDNQMKWLSETLTLLENDENIDHVFVTVHTPFFPNGGHVEDDMWYDGNNDPRPVVGSTPVEKGIIERRDELLDIIVNHHQKPKAILTGDEHNYCRTILNSDTDMYGRGYKGSKIKLDREIWQINNGAAGAPYYAQVQTPWSDSVYGFTTQHAVVFFHVQGNSIKVEVYNPESLLLIDSFDLQ